MDTPEDPSQHAISLGNIAVNLDNYGVFVDEEFVELSVQEFEVLRVMLDNPDKILPYTTITQMIWRAAGKRQIRNLNVLIHRLRLKLSKAEPFVIQTVRGRGYGLVQARASPGRPDRPLEARLMGT